MSRPATKYCKVPAVRLARMLFERKHCLNVLRECEAALEARGSYSPVRLRKLILNMEKPL